MAAFDREAARANAALELANMTDLRRFKLGDLVTMDTLFCKPPKSAQDWRGSVRLLRTVCGLANRLSRRSRRLGGSSRPGTGGTAPRGQGGDGRSATRPRGPQTIGETMSGRSRFLFQW
jgi:hypothetical protein